MRRGAKAVQERFHTSKIVKLFSTLNIFIDTVILSFSFCYLVVDGD